MAVPGHAEAAAAVLSAPRGGTAIECRCEIVMLHLRRVVIDCDSVNTPAMSDPTSDRPRIRNIADLARIAGVSPGTVSRALSGTGLISQKTRERIQELARQHDFRPNVMARNLRIRRTGAIGVAAPLDAANGHACDDPGCVASVLGQLADMLEERGYVLMLSRLRSGDRRPAFALAESGRVDAVLLLGGTPDGGEERDVGVPVLSWDGRDAPAMVHSLLARIAPAPLG